jgi:hypothetical protein
LGLAGVLGSHEEHAIHAGQCGVNRLGTVQVARDGLDLLAKPLPCRSDVAHEGARPLPGRDQKLDDLAANPAGRPRHQDHAFAPRSRPPTASLA